MTNRVFHQELRSDLPMHEVNHTAREVFYERLVPRAKSLVQQVLFGDLCEYPKDNDYTPVEAWLRQLRWRRKLRSIRQNLYSYQHHALMLQRHFAIANDFKRYYETQALFDACGTAASYIEELITLDANQS